MQGETDQSYNIVTSHVENEIDKFMSCGILACGFSRVKCECGEDFLIAFSCKGKSICPSCNTRRMHETTANLVDNIFPKVPVRQWVLSFPKRIRCYLRIDSKLASKVLKIFNLQLEQAYQEILNVNEQAKIGGVNFIHRFGSFLNNNFHHHLVLMDGVFLPDPDGKLTFKSIHNLTEYTVSDILNIVRKKTMKLLVKYDYLEQFEADKMLTWKNNGGFSLNAKVRIEANNRQGLVKLLSYCARPPFASNRLHRTTSPDILIYKLKKPTYKGQTKLILSPLEFVDKIVKLIPPPKIHRHRYIGVLAPNSPHRKQVIAQADQFWNDGAERIEESVDVNNDEKSGRGSRSVHLWAMLLARIYEVFPLICPKCQQEMQIIAFIRDPESIRSILECIGEPVIPPQLKPSRGPPEFDDFDQTNQCDAFNQSSEFEFDQSISW